MAMVPIGPFVRFVIMGGAAVYSNWDTISGLFDRSVSDASHPIYGYYVQNIFEMRDQAGSYSVRERGMFGVHWINTTGGDLDTTWTSADYAAIETGCSTMWNAIVSYWSQDVRLVEHRWYPFGPGVNPPSPPSRVTTLGTPLAGTGSWMFPHQMACTVTLRTPLRRHWGRIYLPILNPPTGAGGELGTAGVDAIAAAANNYLKSGSAQGVTPVVWDRARRAALGVTSVEVDSIPDVIRRRRPRSTAYRKIYTS